MARMGSPILQKLEDLRLQSNSRFVQEKHDPTERIVKCGENTFDRDEKYTINGYPAESFDWNK